MVWAVKFPQYLVRNNIFQREFSAKGPAQRKGSTPYLSTYLQYYLVRICGLSGAGSPDSRVGVFGLGWLNQMGTAREKCRVEERPALQSSSVEQGKAQRPWPSKFKPPQPSPSHLQYCTVQYLLLPVWPWVVPRVPCLCAPFPV
jgi:hypothetical protein